MSNVNTLTREDAETRGPVTRTTVAIPDDILIEAKAFCVTGKTNVNELLISGLRRELDARKAEAHAPDGNAAAGSALRKPATPTSTKK